MKKQRPSAMLSAAALAFVIAMCGACVNEKTPDAPVKDPSDVGGEVPPVLSAGYEGTVDGIAFSLPDLGEEVSLHTELQTEYLKNETVASVLDYAKGTEELSAPAPVLFTWTAEGASSDMVYTLRVSETENMADPQTFTTAELSLGVYNLKIATTYWWTVAAGDAESGAAVFTTESLGPRNLFVEGVANVRDVGGWPTEDGGRVKQGLLYRTGRLNENYNGKTSIAEAGVRTMLGTLKVKTEIDLRGGKNDPDEYAPSVNKSVLDGVAYHHIGMDWEVSDMLIGNRKEIRSVFALLAQESNYPMFYHCSIGTDRTGLITYLLLGYLGVDEQDIYRDYLFSNFANIGGSRDLGGITTKYVATIKNKYGGKSTPLSKKCRAALLDIGVEPAELEAISEIFTA